MELKAGKRTTKEIKKFLNASYKTNPKENIEGFVLDKSLSKETGKVYHNPETGETIVVHRGTQGIMDWKNNVAYALGNYEKTDRYKKGKSIQDKAEKKYGAENISTLGHSQGSILARKLGKDTKEIININPAYLLEKPAENEYTIRSSGDVVSALYAPVAKTRQIFSPKTSKERDITIPAERNSNILDEHSYKILDRLGDKQIGAGNNISSNNIMEGGKRFNRLGYTGEDIDFIGGGIFTNNNNGAVGTAHLNQGTNPYGTRGGASIFKSVGKAFDKVGKSAKKTFAPVGKALDKATKGLSTATDAINPMALALKDKKTSKLMRQSGDTTRDYIVPAIVSAGKPVFDATMMAASTAATGNPVLGKVVGDAMWDNMVTKTGSDLRKNQKSKELGSAATILGEAAASSIGGKSRYRLKGGMMNEVTPNPTPDITPTGTPVGEIDDDILQELINIVTQRATPQRLTRFRTLVRGNISGFITTLNEHFGNLPAQSQQRILFERHFPDYEDNVTVAGGRNCKAIKRLSVKGGGRSILQKLYDLVNPPASFEIWRERNQQRRFTKAEKDYINDQHKVLKLRQDADAFEKDAKEKYKQSKKSASEYGEFEDITPLQAERLTMENEDFASKDLGTEGRIAKEDSDYSMNGNGRKRRIKRL